MYVFHTLFVFLDKSLLHMQHQWMHFRNIFFKTNIRNGYAIWYDTVSLEIFSMLNQDKIEERKILWNQAKKTQTHTDHWYNNISKYFIVLYDLLIISMRIINIQWFS